MRFVLWGLILLGLTLVGFTTAYEVGLNIGEEEFQLYRSYGLTFLAALIIIEGFFIVSRRRPEAPVVANVEEKKRLEEMAANLERTTSDNQLLRESVKTLEDRLQTVVKEQEQLKASKGDQEVMNFVSLLQGKGRFVDFLMDDISKYADAQIGAAARVVHQGCAQVIKDYFDIAPVASDAAEGSTVTLQEDYDTHSYKLLGKIKGEPPFSGKVLHRGWVTNEIRLPEATSRSLTGAKIIAPAEVEIH